MNHSGPRVWLQGGGEMASGVAVRLFRENCQVVIAEQSNPKAVRRLVSFSEAVYEGSASVSGVPAYRVEPAELEFSDEKILLTIDPQAEQCRRLQPDVVVDARMTKRDPVPFDSGDSPVIGLGPGFVCGSHAAIVIETMRGPELGAVITSGSSIPYTGVPGLVGGVTIDRVLRSPAAGKLQPYKKIGDLVEIGDAVASVSGLPVLSPISGMVRGLIRADGELYAGQKVGDIDPRGATVKPYELSDKALAIGAGVWRAVTDLCRTKIGRMQGDSLS